MRIPEGNRPGQSRRSPFQVGERLRELRLLRGWTLRDLSRHSGVSQGMLSKLESRSVNPSLSVIAKLAAAFEQTIGQFLGEDGEGIRSEMIVFRKQQRSVVVNEVTGYVREELSPALHGRGLEFIRSTIPAHCGPLVFPPHTANVEELIFVEQGTLRVSVGPRHATLRSGDVALLKPLARHSYENPGPEPCVCYIIIDSHRVLAPTANAEDSGPEREDGRPGRPVAPGRRRSLAGRASGRRTRITSHGGMEPK